MPEDLRSLNNKEAIKAKLQQLWNGDVPLKYTFWLYYLLFMVVLVVLGTIGGMLGFLIHLVSLAWAGFMVKPILSSAEKYEGEQAYALLAKILAVLILIGVVGRLVGPY